uniref:hypothetical protein n=1 Tax=uncultured Rhizobium sp. TaxID=155567 RepID=UPI0026217ED5|nr:hypothetical protein [uncultured Rhizobium sp.]
MQIQSSYTSSSYVTPTKVPKSDNQSADFAAVSQEKPVLEEMLENLRRDASVRDRITENDDGTYSFDIRASGWTENSYAAFAIVTELNGGSFSLIGNSGKSYPTEADTDLFKQMTGYNMLNLGGSLVVLDDAGFPPAAADQSSVQQAFDFILDVASFRSSGYLEGELTAENVGSFLSAYNIAPGSSAFIDQLLEELNKAASPIVSEDDAVAELMDLVTT